MSTTAVGTLVRSDEDLHESTSVPIEPRTHPAPVYRPDIDGLRAVAVLAVVAFHAFPERVRGGYVGVDIFFVISGYLISTIIVRGLTERSFSFAEFYGRRIRRIFTALIVVLLACYTAGRIVLLPHEAQALGQHIAAGAGFASNFLLWADSGYFDATATSKPLLHLWSLGIEEQFYLIWPLLLACVVRTRRRTLPFIVSVLGVSFALNVLLIHRNPVATFYSPLTRFWELMMGSALACLVLTHRIPARGATMRAVAGSMAIVIAVFLLDERSAFPGWWALLPTAGAWLLISAGPRTWINRTILSNRAAVWIGLISFPLYLWHWPLLSFLQITSDAATPAGTARALMVAGSILLAWFTYVLFERPIRSGGHARQKIAALCVLMIVVGALGYRESVTAAFAETGPRFVRELAKFTYDYKKAYRGGSCFLWVKQDASEFGDCLGDARVFLWGDSHAAHLYPGLRTALPGIAQYTKAGCPPFIDTDIDGVHNCRETNAHVLDVIEQHRPERVILAGAWAVHDWKRVRHTLEALRRVGIARIDLVGPFPEWTNGLPRTLLTSIRRTGTNRLPVRLAKGWDPAGVVLDREMAQFAAAQGVSYIAPMRILCDSEGCLTSLRDDAAALVTWDQSHLTDVGSNYVASRFPR